MKKIYIGMAILLACINVQAQYKKASFLNKSGRTYDLGFSGRFMSNGGGTVPGIYYSYGRDKGKRLFHWFDLELLLPSKFEYQTIDKNNPQDIVSVTGKSKIGLAYRYNLAWYLTDIENSKSKFKPFATLGINFLITGGTAQQDGYNVSPAPADPEKIISLSAFSYGANAGLGAIFTLSEKVGIKLIAGYNYQDQSDPQSNSVDGYKIYKLYSSHPYVTVGVRFVINRDDE